MRLICGVMRLDGGVVSSDLLERMVAQMDVAKRRPAHSDFRDGAVAMAVLDYSGVPAPAFPRSEAGVIAADVRLDEPDALASALRCGADDQAALLLEAVSQSGSPAAALGDFAFAIWDDRTGTLTCGRDHFGVRPFYFVHKPGELFAFASAPAALHGSGIVPARLDAAVAVKLALHLPSATDSPIEQISRLQPAHLLEVSASGFASRRYWQLDRAKVGTSELSPDEAAVELRRLVEQAIQARIQDGVPVAAHLSGGLDSSAIAILAARALKAEGRSLPAYSFLDRLRNDVQLEDETEFARSCVEQEGNIDWSLVRPSAAEFEGYPCDPGLMLPLGPESPEVQVASEAESRGVQRILSGWGGDEAATFNGRGAMAELAKRGRWGQFRTEIDAIVRERRFPKAWVLYHEVASYWVAGLLPGGLIRGTRRLLKRKPSPHQLLRKVLKSSVRPQPDDDLSLTMVGDGRENRWRLIHGRHIARRTEIWAEIGARHGLAYTFPLLDRRVVEFALSLPSDYFFSGGFRRRPFRDAMKDVLPEKVRTRHLKYQPFPSRYIDLAEARDVFHARLKAFERDDRVRGVLDLDALEALIAQFPSPDAVREAMARGDAPPSGEILVAAGWAMELAAAIAQHGVPGGSPTA